MLKHYPALVEYVYNSRYAIAGQIQRRFPDYIRSQRTAQYQLASLVQLGYLATAPVRSTAPHFPFVYCVTKRGVKLIRETYQELGVAWEGTATESTKAKGTALTSLLHELLLTEFALGIRLAAEQHENVELLSTERRYFRKDKRLSYEEHGQQRHVIPDAGFVLRIDDRPLMHFVELDNGTMPMSRLREKFSSYAKWFASIQRDNKGCPNSRFVVIAHSYYASRSDDVRLRKLYAELLRLPANLRKRTWLTTAKQLKRQSSASSAETARCWLRIGDFAKWRTRSDNGDSPFSASPSRQELLKTQQDASLLHSLFPEKCDT